MSNNEKQNEGCNSIDAEELHKIYLSCDENSLNTWKIEEKCRLKVKSIQDIENSTTQDDEENKWLEASLHDIKSSIEEVRDSIICIDRINSSFHETLAHLDVKQKKKELSISKSRSDFELQLFIRMELCQKEEERLNNIPEIKELRLAECELETTKSEFDELVINHENLIEKIDKTNKENDKNVNDIVVQFANSYVEMLSLNKREDNCRALLRKLDVEYEEKLNMKKSLLESIKNKANTISLWTNTHCQFNLKTKDVNLEPLNQKLNPNFTVSLNNLNRTSEQIMNIEHLKLKSKKKTLTLPSNEKISATVIDTSNIGKNMNNNLVESNSTNINDMCIDSSIIKNASKDNVNTDPFSRNDLTEPKTVSYCNNKEVMMNECNFDHQTKKLKITDNNSHFKFKKPYNLIQNKIHNDQNRIFPMMFQPSVTNENMYMEKHVVENQKKNESVDTSNENYNNKESITGDIRHLQRNKDFQSISQSNSSPITDNVSSIQDNNSSPREENFLLSNLFWDNSGEELYENSFSDSFCDLDSEIFGNYDDVTQYSDMQLDFTNSFNKYDMSQNLNKSSKKMGISSNTTKNINK